VIDSSDVARAQAGMLAAAGIVAAKQIAVRNPPPTLPQVRPSSLGDLPRLFGREDQSVMGRVARLSAAALVYSANKNAVQSEKILHERERKVLRKVDAETQRHRDTDRSCPHCRLLYGSTYEDQKRWRKMPPIAVVNHSARVNLQFDPETNISRADITRFQVVVPQRVATTLIRLSHPLHWADTPGDLFQKSDPVDGDGRPVDKAGGPGVVKAEWEKSARDQAFVLEDVVWPLNEDIRANSENIITILKFRRGNGDSSLSYDYSLQRCVRSNFGIAWEPSGLDLDGGDFAAFSAPLGLLADAVVAAQAFPDEMVMRRDVLSLRATHDSAVSDTLYEGWSDDNPKNPKNPNTPKSLPDLVERREILKELQTLNEKLEQRWPELAPFHLLTVSASKELHFTIPENSPIELWHTLTWTAPAILFMFLNQAVCLAPHVLLDGVVEPVQNPKGFAFTIGGVPYDY
jgi:hypothetical protein